MQVNRLGHWLSWRLALAVAIASITAFAVSALIVQRGIDFIERERLGELLERAAGTLAATADAMLTSTRDYAGWDDTYAFMASGDPAYIETHYHSASAAVIGIDWVAFIGHDRQVLRAFRVATGEQDVALEAPLLAQLGRLVGELDPTRLDQDDHALLWSGTRPLLVAHAAITDSTRSRAPRGWLLFGRDLAGGVVDMAGAAGALRFRLQPLDSLAGAPLKISNEGALWLGWRSLAPWPAAVFLSQPPAYSAQKNAVLAWLALSTAGLAGLSMGALTWLFRRKVVARLERFVELARHNTGAGGSHQPWPVRGSDEIDLLAGALNQMMERVDQRDRSLAHLASHDPLTELGNRPQLMERLQSVQARLQQHTDARWSLVLADLDRLKSINDVFGHAAGDRVLTVVAERIHSLLRGDDLAVRLGGDEFAVLLADSGPGHAQAYCERLAERLDQAIEYEGQFLFVTASIGIASVEAGLTAHALLSRADRAMERAKRAGGNAALMFDADRDQPRDRVGASASLGEHQQPDQGSA